VNPMRKSQATAGNDNRVTEGDVCRRQPAGTGHQPQHAEDQAVLAASMNCPECGEAATSQAPVEPVPWEARGMQRPQWSHTNGSALCPVPGPAGGYQPAQPVATRQPDPDTTRLDPPPSMRHRWPSSGAAREAEAD
jgi:hypothetical protein